MTFSETFLVFLVILVVFLGVKFGFRKSCLCKRNDKYKVWLEAPLTSDLTKWFLPSPRHEIKVFARSRRNNIGENLRCCEATARCRDGSAPAATLVRWHRLLLNCRTWRPPPSPWQGMWAAWLSPAIAINPELPPGHCLARIHPGLPPGY